MSSSPHSELFVTSPRIELKLTEEQKQQYISDFFSKKLKYPILTTPIIDDAISLDFLPYEERDKILKDPNKISIFFISFNQESPRTNQALEYLEFQPDACQILSFHDYYVTDDHPIKVLINYMHYLAAKYKELLKIVSVRNQIKKRELNEKQHNRSQNIKTNNQNTTLFTHEQQQSELMSKSFNTRSIDFLKSSYEDKLTFQMKKNQEYLRTLAKHKELEEKHINSLHDYYQSIVPIRSEKVKAVQLATQLKQQQRKQVFVQRHNKTLNKIRALEEKSQEGRQKVQEQLKHKFEQTEANRSQMENNHKKEMQELQERIFKKDLERQEKRNMAIQEEQQMIEDIMEKNFAKEQLAEQLLNRLKEESKIKKNENQLKLEKAQLRVQVTFEEQQTKSLKQYIQVADSGIKMVQEQMDNKHKKLNLLKSKSEQQFTKVKRNKQKLESEQNQKIEQIKQREDEKNITNRLFSIQSNLENKIKEQSDKNKTRIQRALRNTQAFAEEKQQSQQRLIRKIMEENQKSKSMKLQQEQYRDAILKQHLLLRQSVDKLVQG